MGLQPVGLGPGAEVSHCVSCFTSHLTHKSRRRRSSRLVARIPVLEHSPAKLVREGRREEEFNFTRRPRAEALDAPGVTARDEQPEAEQRLRRVENVLFPATGGANVGDELLARDEYSSAARL